MPDPLTTDDILAFYDRHIVFAGDLAGLPAAGRQHLRTQYVAGVRDSRPATAEITRSRDHLAGLYVEEGEVEVSTADLLIDHPDVRVWELDLVTKYADVLGYSSDGVVMLHATEYSIKVVEQARGQATLIHLGLPVTRDWAVLAMCARYTCRIVAYRDPGYDERPRADQNQVAEEAVAARPVTDDRQGG